jgi:predicted nucleotidyltransferase
VELQFRTDNPRADEALEEILSAFEDSFSGGRCRYVLLGSYATGTARETSDLDLLIVYPHELSDQLRDRADQLIAQLKQLLHVEADIAFCSVDSCPPAWAVALKAGRTVFGDDSLQPPLPAIEDYASALTDDVLSLMRGLRAGRQLTSPLEAPNPQLLILGYEAKALRDVEGHWAPSTKALSMITFWGASTLIARAGQYVHSKDEVVDLYCKLIGDEWTELLIAVNRICLRDSGYAIPTDDTRLAELRELAEQVLRFENYLLETFTATRR